MTLALIILLSSAINPSDASGRTDRISREIPSVNQFPCYLDLIPLLFRCYSAVVFRCYSAANSAKPRGQFVEIPESPNIFETIFRNRRPHRIFFPDNSGIWISSRPGISPRRAAESRLSGAGHARKTRICPRPARPIASAPAAQSPIAARLAARERAAPPASNSTSVVTARTQHAPGDEVALLVRPVGPAVD